MNRLSRGFVTSLALALVVTASAASAPPPPGASAEAAMDQGKPRVRATLVTDAGMLTAGESFAAGVRLELDPGWHVYWKNPGQSGLSTKVELASANVDFDPLVWPTPEVFVDRTGTITTYGYADEVLLWAPARVLKEARGGIEITAQVDLLACAEVCIPGRVVLRRVLPLGQSASSDADTAPLFARYRDRLPRAGESLGLSSELVVSQSAVRPGDDFRMSLVLRCQGAACAKLQPLADANQTLVPEELLGVELKPEATWTLPEGGLVVALSGRALPDEAPAQQSFAGLVRVRAPGPEIIPAVTFATTLPRAAAGASISAVDSPLLEVPAAARPAASPSGPAALWQMVLFALLGGVILNLMPCVLPVLFLKIAAVARLAHEERRTVVRHDLAYAAGVVGSMMALALAVIVLRRLGVIVGWGFQFQSPTFAALVAALLTLMALSMFGVFTPTVSSGWLSSAVARSHGYVKSGLEGVLMVVVATPCTAPFLGSAVGFALTQSAFIVGLIFIAIGVGLAAPVVLLTLVPGLSRLVPRPGVWMEHMKQALGFTLLAAVLWLLWLIGRFAGADGVIQTLAALLLVAAAAWLAGLLQRHDGAVFGGVRLLVVGGLFAAAIWLAMIESSHEAKAGAEGPWKPYSRAAVEAAVQNGETVFVNFTADWCLTCKVFERTVLESEDVQRVFADNKVSLYTADWTRRDETIRKELERFGRAGVPMYVVYKPGAASPLLLPEVVTPSMLTEALVATR